MADAYDEVRDFIVLHYLLSRRNEPFWRDSRSVEISDTLRGVLELYDETGRIAWAKMQVFPETSYFFILAGAGGIPEAPDPGSGDSSRRRSLADPRSGAGGEPALCRAHANPRELSRAPSSDELMSQDHDLVRRIYDLGAPYGLERSAKLEDGVVLDDRFLLSVHRQAFCLNSLESLASIGAALSMPAELGRAFGSALESADVIHFGFEGAAGSEIYKIYFEYSQRTRTAMAAHNQQPTLCTLPSNGTAFTPASTRRPAMSGRRAARAPTSRRGCGN